MGCLKFGNVLYLINNLNKKHSFTISGMQVFFVELSQWNFLNIKLRQPLNEYSENIM